MKRESVIIIGAGIAGLAAGCYAQMNGLQSRIFELHFLPGGLCTAWRRGEFVFDGAIRYLTGINPGTRIHRMWNELAILNARPIHYYDEFIAYEGRDGTTVHIYSDIDRLEEHLLTLAPEDGEPIMDLTNALRSFTQMDLPVDMTPNTLQDFGQLGSGVLPALLPVLKWQAVSVREFAERFANPLLREAFPAFFQLTPEDFPMMLFLSTLAMMNDREAGYPIGGSLAFAEDLARRYLQLGGQIDYKARVERILVDQEHGKARACGVRLCDGSEHFADRVISACDGRSAIFDLLRGEFVSDDLRERYAESPVAKSILQVSLGLDMDFSSIPAALDFPTAEPVRLGNMTHDRLVLKHYCFDPTLAPRGKSVITFWCEADFGYWQALRSDPGLYNAEKAAAAQAVIAALDRRFPGSAARVEEIDVATPVTYERYTANWRGSFSGWALGAHKMTMMLKMGMRKTLPGLDDFYMAGQWVEPGGNVELSAASGRDVIKDICREEDWGFRTSPLS
jgi:phytoene dehydrogenase-like protein